MSAHVWREQVLCAFFLVVPIFESRMSHACAVGGACCLPCRCIFAYTQAYSSRFSYEACRLQGCHVVWLFNQAVWREPRIKWLDMTVGSYRTKFTMMAFNLVAGIRMGRNVHNGHLYFDPHSLIKIAAAIHRVHGEYPSQTQHIYRMHDSWHGRMHVLRCSMLTCMQWQIQTCILHLCTVDVLLVSNQHGLIVTISSSGKMSSTWQSVSWGHISIKNVLYRLPNWSCYVHMQVCCQQLNGVWIDVDYVI